MRPESQPNPPNEPVYYDEPASLDPRQLLAIARRRWKPAALVALVAIAASVLVFSLTPREYSATAIIQITRYMPLPEYGQMPWSDELWDRDYYPTQHRLLRSRGLAERVVRSLRLADDPEFAPERARFDVDAAEGMAAAHTDALEIGRLATHLVSGLSIRPIEETHLVQVGYRSGSPELSARVTNGMVNAFIEWNLEHHAQMVDNASSYLDSQIDALEDSLAAKQADLQRYGRIPNTPSEDPEAIGDFQRLRALNADYVAALVESIQRQAEYERLVATPDELTAERLSPGLITRLRQQQLELELEYANQLEVYKPEWPEMVEMRNRIEKGRANLDRTIASTVEQARQTASSQATAAKQRTASLETQIERVKEEIAATGSVAVAQSNLKVEVDTQRQLMDELLRLRSETELAARLQGTRETNVRVVEEALLPQRPVHPVLRRYLATGLGLGLMAAVGLVFLLEYFDRSIKTADELEQSLGLPVLAVIPDLAKLSPKGDADSPTRRPDLVAHDYPWHAAAEIYRGLGSSLLFMGGRQVSTLAVTSAHSGEGKTTTVCNLGIVLAQLGRRVLLVDGDLRRPRLHTAFGVPNERGLAECLAGAIEPTSAAQATMVPGLSIIPAGSLDDDPWKLLGAGRLQALLNQLGNQFNLVVLDTPPVLAVSDPFMLGPAVDEVVFCCEEGRVAREEIASCVERLERTNVNLVGAVLNRGRHDSAGYGYSGYQAYYDRGEAYGSDRRQGSA